MNQNLLNISKDEWLIIFDEVMKKLNVYKIYYYQHNTSWKHYKCENIEEIYDTCKELFESHLDYIHHHIEKLNNDEGCTSGGFNVFFRDDRLFILYENREGKKTIQNTNDKDCVEVASVNCFDVLRNKKINKICSKLETK